MLTLSKLLKDLASLREAGVSEDRWGALVIHFRNFQAVIRDMFLRCSSILTISVVVIALPVMLYLWLFYIAFLAD